MTVPTEDNDKPSPDGDDPVKSLPEDGGESVLPDQDYPPAQQDISIEPDPDAVTIIQPVSADVADTVPEMPQAISRSKARSDDPMVDAVLEGKYRVEKLLGQGGMARVYHGWHLLLEKPIAIKFIRGDLLSDEKLRDRFFREARLATELVHPNIVQTRDFGMTDDGMFFIVMDYCSGTPVASLIREFGPQEPHRCVKMIMEVLDALSEAHRQSIIHRDIKGENLMITDEGRVMVLDFGLAKVIGTDSKAFEVDQMVTQPGGIVGTPAYLSPEQASGRPCDARTDIYSVGILLYEMLCGVRPFTGGTLHALLMQHINEPPMRPEERVPGLEIPRVLTDIVLKALAKDPNRRWQTADEFKTALKEFNCNKTVEGLANGEQPSLPTWLRTSKFGRVAALIILLSCGAGGYYFLLNNDSDPELINQTSTRPTIVATRRNTIRDRFKITDDSKTLARLQEAKTALERAKDLGDTPVSQRYAMATVGEARKKIEESLKLAAVPDGSASELAAINVATSLYKSARKAAKQELDKELQAAQREFEKKIADLLKAEVVKFAPEEFRRIERERNQLPKEANLDRLDTYKVLTDQCQSIFSIIKKRKQIVDLTAKVNSVANDAKLIKRDVENIIGDRYKDKLALLAESMPDEGLTDQNRIIALSQSEFGEYQKQLTKDLETWQELKTAYSNLKSAIHQSQIDSKQHFDELNKLRELTLEKLQAINRMSESDEAIVWSKTEAGLLIQSELEIIRSAWKIQNESWKAISPSMPMSSLGKFTREIETLANKLDDFRDRFNASLMSFQAQKRSLEEAISDQERVLDTIRQSKFLSAVNPEFEQAGLDLEDAKKDLEIGGLDSVSGKIGRIDLNLQRIQLRIRDTGAVTNLLSGLISAINRENRERIASLYLDPETDRGFFKKLFREFDNLHIEFGPPTFEGNAASAVVTKFTRVDRIRNKRTSLSGYKIFLQKEGSNWKVVRLYSPR